MAKPKSSKSEVSNQPVKSESVKLTPQDQQTLAAHLEKIDLKHKADRLFSSAADARRRYDWEWLVRDLYRRGYHFSRYDQSSRTVAINSNAGGKVPINLVAAQMRLIRNQVTSFRPKWEVLPRNGSKSAYSNAKFSQKALDYYFDLLRLRKTIKETITQGLMYSVGGPWQIGYDPEANGGEGDIFVWLLDTFDFYIDPNCTDGLTFSDAEYVVKAVRKPLNAVKANPNYTFTSDDPRGDSRLAASEYKQFLKLALRQINQSSGEDEEAGVILKETWIKERVTDENSEKLIKELKDNDENADGLRIGETLMRVISSIDSQETPLRVQLLRREDFPFVMYQADINPTEVYGESWIKHVIPPNRVLDALESSIFEYNYIFAKGRMVVDKNSGVRIIANQHGQIVEKNPGSTVTPLPIPPLPQTYQMQINNMRSYIEDLGGAHDVSQGKIPAGIRSGVGIAELKAADATNASDLVDNMEEFLTEVGKKILKEIANNFDVPKVLNVLGKGGAAEHFAVVGEKAGKRNKDTVKIGGETFKIVTIGEQNEVRVSIGSWLAYTKSAQIDKLSEFFQAGIIDQKTFLEHADFPNAEGIVEQTRKEELLKKFRGSSAAKGMPTDEEIAQQENVMMTIEGREVDPLPEDNHEVHLLIHQEALGATGNPLVEEHMSKHEKMILKQEKEGINEMVAPPMREMDQETQMEPEMGMEGMPPAPPPAPPAAPPGQAPEIPPELMAMMGQ